MNLESRALRLGVVAAVAVAAGLIVWWMRDYPRRTVERSLEEALGAEVRVGGLSVLGTRDFVLRDVVVSHVAGQPYLDRLEIGRLEVRGRLTEIEAGRIDFLRASQAVVHIAPPSAEAREAQAERPAEGQPVEAHVGHLEVPLGKVLIAAAGTEAALEIDASIDGVGGALAGEIRLTSESLPVAPLLATAFPGGSPRASGTIEGFEGSVTISEEGRLFRLAARSRELSLSQGERRARIAGPGLDGSFAYDRVGDRLRVEMRPLLSFLGRGEIRAELDARNHDLLTIDGALQGVDVASLAVVLGILPEGWALEGSADLEVRGRSKNVLDYHLASRLERLSADLDETSFETEGATLDVEGTARLDRDHSGASIGGVLEVPFGTGDVDGHVIPSGLFPMRLKLHGDFAAGDPATMTGQLAIEARRGGKVSAGGDIVLAKGGPTGQVAWKWTDAHLPELVGLAEESGFELPERVRVAGALLVEGSLSGAIAQPSVTALARAASLEIVGEADAPGAAPAYFLENGSAEARVVWRDPRSVIEVRSLELRGDVGAEELEARIALSASGHFDPGSGTARIERAVVEAPGLGRLRLDGRWSGGPRPEASAEAHLDQLDITKWQSFLRPITGDIAPGYSGKGAGEASFVVTLDGDGLFKGRGEAAIRGSGFSSDDGSRVVEGLDTEWKVELDRPRSGPLTIVATASVGGFQVLWGTFFADYSQLPSAAEASVQIDGLPPGGDRRTPWKGRFVWSYPEGPRFEAVVANDGRGALDYVLDARVGDLERMLERYLKGPMGDAIPFFARIRGGGAVHAALRGSLSDAVRTVAGTVSLEDVNLEGTAGFAEVNRLSLDLPIDLRFGPRGEDGSRPVSGPGLKGSLRFSRLAFGGLEIPETSTGLEIRADTVGLEEGLAVPFLGGVLGFENLSFAEITRRSRRVETAVLLSHVALAEASRAFELPPLEGEMNGYFPKVRLTGPTFAVDGGGEFSLFGGKLTVGGISGEDMLTRYPKLAFSASFEDIDLGQVTRTFDVGEMTGIVRGYLRECVLFRGVPVRFDAEIRTVDRKGVDRTINVKALNNIAILGTGGRISAFDRGIHKFFDNYTYDRLGIHATLVDDVFLLRGLEHRGDRELFLKGQFPLRIDVVNVEPGKTVSFSTMLERVQSLEFSTGAPPPRP